MATRLFQAGFELNSIAEFNSEITDPNSGGSPVISSTKAKTGTYSMRWQILTNGRGWAFASNLAQLRAGFFVNHNGLSNASNSIAYLVRLPNAGGTNPATIRWNGTNGLLEMLIGGSVVASVAWTSAGLSSVNTWYHVGVTFKRHASTGYFTIYADGVAVLTFTGNTGSQDITSIIYMGEGQATFGGWAASAYIDDAYVDDDTSGSDVAPNSPRFLWSLANAAGTNAEFTPLSSTNISNVDDTDASAPDDDTTYNSAAAAGLKDTFNTTNITVPAGLQIAAAIPVAWAKRSNAGISSQLDLLAYNGSLTTGSAKTPTTAYGPVWDRFVTDPSAAAWTEASFNAAEFGYKSDGSY